MKFAIVDPKRRELRYLDADDLKVVERLAGLNHVDHGRVSPSVAIVVYEESIFVPPDMTCYFALAGKLYAGTAVLYGHDEAGESIDLSEEDVSILGLTWFRDASVVEDAIRRGEVLRPTVGIPGETFWRWPEPDPWSAMKKVEVAIQKHFEKGGRSITIGGDIRVVSLPDETNK